MANSETRFRLEAGLDKWLEVQAAKAGISKTKYIIQVLEVHKLGLKYSTNDFTEDSTEKSRKLAIVDLSCENSTQDSTQNSTNIRLTAIEDRLDRLEASDSTKDSTNDSTENARSVTVSDFILNTPHKTPHKTPQETPQDTPQETPQKTPQTLTNKELSAYLGYGNETMEDKQAFSLVCAAGRTEEGYLAANGDRWFVTGRGKASSWDKR